jgi:hypothetical protein
MKKETACQYRSKEVRFLFHTEETSEQGKLSESIT